MFKAQNDTFDIRIADLIDNTLYIVKKSDDEKSQWYYQDLYDKYQILDLICEAKTNSENLDEFVEFVNSISIAIAEEIYG